ncbi:MAG: DNA replication and repair protein RecF [Acidobacteriota bacterium]|nr:DNA replication and repair protein RecF [Acidobacteriota bacterium]MDH3783887.1 DNA replication and repair protein RecF [Acidobacteriota bacterium]
MWLRRLEADRLRNLRAVDLELSPGLTLLQGRNGQGKTSLLEAVYLLGTARSFRSRRIEELIPWDGGTLRVKGQLDSILGAADLGFWMDDSGRRLAVNDADKEFDQFIGRLAVVDLSGDRIRLLREGPEERRRFLDRGVLGTDNSYLHRLGDYRKILLQRNALLRGHGRSGGSAGQLDAWDQQLVEAGEIVHGARRAYAGRLATAIGDGGRMLFPDGQTLRLRYRPSPALPDSEESPNFKAIFTEKLEQARARDFEVGHTSVGPHRDEMRIHLDEIDLRKFGSAGQLRASLIVLKLGKMALLKKDRGEDPLFLMDDFDSDIDDVRAAALVEFLQGSGYQALVATSKEGLAGKLGERVREIQRIRIEDGHASPLT